MTRVPSWLPNAISFARMLLVPAWVLCAEAANRAADANENSDGSRLLAAGLLLTIGASDVLDGWLARRFQLQSKIGATLDAVADKLAQVVLFTYLALRPGMAFAAVPVWFLALLIIRDGLLLIGYVVTRWRRGHVETDHQLHGRVSSLVLFVLLVSYSAGVTATLLQPLTAFAAAVTAGSTMLYVVRGVHRYRTAGPSAAIADGDRQ